MKTYTVNGPFPFGPHAPGSTFQAQPDPVIERAVNRGSLAEVPDPAPEATTARKAHPLKSKEDTK